MLSCIEYGYFKIDGVIIPIKKEAIDFSNFNIEEEKKHLAFTKRVVEALDLLNCKDDIDFSSLSFKDMRNLERLIAAFVYKQPVEHLNPDLPPIIKLSINTLSFILCLQALDDTKTTYNIYDFFKTEMSFAYEGKDGEMLPTSQYSILQPDDILTVKNIRFDILLPSFKKIEKHYDLFNRANQFLLNLLIAFDKSNGKRTDILKTAHEFADWILHEANEDELPYQIKFLNYLQVIKRERELNISEVSELYSLVECSTTSEEILIGAYLLLGQQKAAEIHFNKLSCELQEAFKTLPIYHFWTKTEA